MSPSSAEDKSPDFNALSAFRTGKDPWVSEGGVWYLLRSVPPRIITLQQQNFALLHARPVHPALLIIITHSDYLPTAGSQAELDWHDVVGIDRRASGEC